MVKNIIKAFHFFMKFWYIFTFTILCWAYFFYLPDYCLNILNYSCDSLYFWIPIALPISAIMFFLSCIFELNKRSDSK